MAGDNVGTDAETSGSAASTAGSLPAGEDLVRLQELLDAMSEPALLVDPRRAADGAIVDFVCVVANEAACLCCGMSRDQIIGGRLHEVMRERPEAGLLAQYCRVLESGEALVLTDVACPPGHPGDPQRVCDLRVARCGQGLSCVWHDTTNHRRAATPAMPEEWYRLMADNVGDVLWLADLDRRRLAYVTPSIERLTGFTPAEAIARGMDLWLTPESALRVREAIATTLACALRDGAAPPLVIELDELRKDGGVRPTETTLKVLPGGDGRPHLLLGVSRDISERRATAEALRRSEEHYRLLAENSGDVVFMAGLDRRAVWIAPTVTRALGWLPEELLGTFIHDLMHPDDRRATDETRMGVYSGPNAVVAEGSLLVRIRTKSGQYRWMSGGATAVADQDGQVMGAVVSLRDVDDLVRAREEAQADRARLRATLDSLLDPHVLLEAVRDEAGSIVDFRFSNANEAACARLRVSRDELVGARLRGLGLEPAAVQLFEEYRAVVETGRPLRLDDVAVPGESDGAKERRFDIRGVRVGDGLSATWRDVTERYQLEEALRRRVTELDALQRVSQKLAERTELSAALQDASREICALFDAAYAHVSLLPEEADAVGEAPPVAVGSPEARPRDEAVLTAEVVESRRSAMMAAGTGPCHLLAVPMMVRAAPTGALIVARAATAAPFEERDFTVAQPLADALAAAVVNERLHQAETRQAALMERQRMARDLHDAVTQSMYAANLVAEALPWMWEHDPEEVRQTLESLRDLVRASLTEMRVLLFELHPESADDLPLGALFERLGDAVAGRTGLSVDVAVSPDLVLPGEVKLAFYRVAQEALSTVGKYAGASRASVVVDADDADAWLTVRDDGERHDFAAPSPESGSVRAMRERAKEIGAALEVESSSGQGTTVSLVWPREEAQRT